MFSQLHMREEQVLLAQDYALEQAEEKGLERGLERGKVEGREEGKLFAFLDMVRQGILTSEVASHQLGMTVSEFEELL
ncbi:adenylosuccinate lyase [Streptococcus pneumoniae]|nr:adenylosuccinate lyase [Streptococcus pneumoniae]